MQLTEIRDQARQMAGTNTNDPVLSDALMTDFVNSALRRLSNKRHWHWDQSTTTFSTVAGTATLSLPSDFKRGLSMRNLSNGYELKPVAPRDAVRWSDTSGEPVFWTIDAGTLYVYPVPESVYSLELEYQAQITELSSDTDEPSVPDYAIDWIIIQAAIYVAVRMHDSDLKKDLQEELIMIEREIERISRQMPISSITARRDWLLPFGR